jgi:hypothetical protein
VPDGAQGEFLRQIAARMVPADRTISARAEVVFRIPPEQARLVLLAARESAHWEHRDGVTRDLVYLPGCEMRLIDAVKDAVGDERWDHWSVSCAAMLATPSSPLR